MTQEAHELVAVIGLGSMGMGVAQSLIRAGMRVSGFDMAHDALARFAEAGGQATHDAAEAARDATAVIVVVVTAAQTEAVLFGADGRDGATATMRKGGVVLSSATMAPTDARRLAERCDRAGLLYLDAPMSGGMVRAAGGELTVMASGSPAAFSRADAVLAAIATKVYRLGDEPGIGASFKMVNQLLAGVHISQLPARPSPSPSGSGSTSTRCSRSSRPRPAIPGCSKTESRTF